MIERYEETGLERVHRICRRFGATAVFDADSRTVTYVPMLQVVKKTSLERV